MDFWLRRCWLWVDTWPTWPLLARDHPCEWEGEWPLCGSTGSLSIEAERLRCFMAFPNS